ncbi:MAG TPA: ABC transporter permease [Chitinophagaceae bacterium]|nr:ABC transporter permease [Chitinophagaceae bacterium]
MNKVGLIIKREYLSRVRKKTFILSTILTPLLFALVIGTVIYITVKNVSHENVAVVDPSGYLKSNLENSKNVTYHFVTDTDTSNFVRKGYSAVLLAPHTGVNTTANFKLITEKSMNRFANDQIDRDISRSLENNLISQELKIDPRRIDSLKEQASAISIDSEKRGEGGKLNKSSFSVANGIGYLTAFLIYITLFIYGAMVMRGVMEEKTNRIAEVIISSVRPFQLMMGKILGIGAVGLTQFLIWIVLIAGISMLLTSMIPHDVLLQAQQTSQQIPGSVQQGSQAMRNIAEAQVGLSSINWGLVVFCFIFFFLGGYLFYAALFAAVGSAVNEDPQDAQSLMMPITIPIVLAIIIMINAINDPSGPLATWSSIIPFFSPIVMMARIPFGVPDTVPYWQLGLSMALLVLGFLFTTWLSARIYRTGILLYGKKPTLKELAKWVRRK